MLTELKNVELPFRLDLKGSAKMKFGVEIEAEGYNILANLDNLSYPNYLLDYEAFYKDSNWSYSDYWVIKPDGTVPDGAEVHSPILTFTKPRWNELQEICQFLSDNGLHPGEHTSLHVHLSSIDFMNDEHDLYNLLKFYAAYEKVLYVFGTGEFMNLRHQIVDRGALPMAFDIWKKFGKENYGKLINRRLLSKINFTYFRGLRLTNLLGLKGTIEFRMANSTLSVPVIQNIINVYTHMFDYVLSDHFDDDLVTRRFRELKYCTDNFDVNDFSVDIDELKEFADLIFDDEMDKLYFLRQCIKEPLGTNKGLVKAKKFY